MAKIYNSVLGMISGKHGSAVAVVANDGTNYIRMHNPKPRNPRSEKQVTQRNKFAYTNYVLAPFHNLFKVTIGSGGLSMGRSHAFKNAISGNHPNYSIDYDKLMISFGALDAQDDVTTVIEYGKMSLSWEFTEAINSKKDDQMNVVIFDEKSRKIIHKDDVAFRSEDNAIVDIPQAWSGLKVHCWVYLKQGSSRSDSVYLGEQSL